MTDLPPVDDTPPDEQQDDPAGPREPGHARFAPWVGAGCYMGPTCVYFSPGAVLLMDNLA